MIPWDDGYRLDEKSRQTLQIGPFVPGRLGVYQTSASVSSPELSSAGKALQAADSATLAYIGGAPLFTEQSHSFRAGARVQKQVVLLNDARSSQPFSFEWSVSLDGKKLASGAKKGVLQVAETHFAPIGFSIPPTLSRAKVEGQITLSATIGGATQNDTFAFRAFEKPTLVGRGAVAVFDPAGETTKMLRSLGYAPQAWNGAPTPLVVIGRKALSPDAKLPADLENYVKSGGRALMMGQSPDFLRDYLGFRTTYHPMTSDE